jgi:hypothetical protein
VALTLHRFSSPGHDSYATSTSAGYPRTTSGVHRPVAVSACRAGVELQGPASPLQTTTSNQQAFVKAPSTRVVTYEAPALYRSQRYGARTCEVHVCPATAAAAATLCAPTTTQATVLHTEGPSPLPIRIRAVPTLWSPSLFRFLSKSRSGLCRSFGCATTCCSNSWRRGCSS